MRHRQTGKRTVSDRLRGRQAARQAGMHRQTKRQAHGRTHTAIQIFSSKILCVGVCVHDCFCECVFSRRHFVLNFSCVLLPLNKADLTMPEQYMQKTWLMTTMKLFEITKPADVKWKYFSSYYCAPNQKQQKNKQTKKKDPEAFRPIKVKIPRVFPVFLVDSLQNRLLFRGYCCPRPPRFGILFPKLSVRHDSLRLHLEWKQQKLSQRKAMDFTAYIWERFSEYIESRSLPWAKSSLPSNFKGPSTAIDLARENTCTYKMQAVI